MIIAKGKKIMTSIRIGVINVCGFIGLKNKDLKWVSDNETFPGRAVKVLISKMLAMMFLKRLLHVHYHSKTNAFILCSRL